MPISPCDQFEASLERAIRRFVADRAALRRRRDSGHDLRFLFARLGLSFADLEALCLAAGGADLCPALRAHLGHRLGTERRRLARLARSGSVLYDAGRHLAVRAAIRWLDDAPGTRTDGEAEVRLPGAVLNGRFRRRRPPGTPTATRPAVFGR